MHYVIDILQHFGCQGESRGATPPAEVRSWLKNPTATTLRCSRMKCRAIVAPIASPSSSSSMIVFLVVSIATPLPPWRYRSRANARKFASTALGFRVWGVWVWGVWGVWGLGVLGLGLWGLLAFGEMEEWENEET